jgi:hypothetical protein
MFMHETCNLKIIVIITTINETQEYVARKHLYIVGRIFLRLVTFSKTIQKFYLNRMFIFSNLGRYQFTIFSLEIVDIRYIETSTPVIFSRDTYRVLIVLSNETIVFHRIRLEDVRTMITVDDFKCYK